MAKRRRVDTPTPEDLQAMEQGFEAKSMSPPSRAAPIAYVAAEAAAMAEPLGAEERAARARDGADAERFRQAEAEGRIAIDIPIAEIAAEELTRDRMKVDADEMAELITSIATHGLRQPIEVFRIETGGFGLLSGYRRLHAVKELEGQGASIRCVVRAPQDVAAAYVSMVEENEIRSNLSHYERGRIAVVAVRQGAFFDVIDAVDVLFAAGSKAKRSKIRSFAAIFEQLGDLLLFPRALSERAGLRIAAALKAGQGDVLRRALAETSALTPEDEAKAMFAALKQGGAPSGQPPRTVIEEDLGNGLVITRTSDTRGHTILLKGDRVDDRALDVAMNALRSALQDL